MFRNFVTYNIILNIPYERLVKLPTDLETSFKTSILMYSYTK